VRPQGNAWQGFGVFISEKGLGACHVPVAYRDFDNAMDEAIDIAMDYLERTGQAVKFTEVERNQLRCAQ
jgi:hypothetical protein